MTPDVAQLSQYGVAGVMLAVLIWFHIRSLKAGEVREQTMIAQSKADREACDARLAKDRQECRDDATRLVARIQLLEDRQHNDTVTIARTCADALKTHADAMKKWTDSETDRLPIIKDIKP